MALQEEEHFCSKAPFDTFVLQSYPINVSIVYYKLSWAGLSKRYFANEQWLETQ